MRYGYFDLLRVIALVRVAAYHSLGLAWLTVALPSMGVMFALAGSLMANSLDSQGFRAIYKRLNRLLPPVWLLAVIMVPVMLATGVAFQWSMLWWLLPLWDPPAGGWVAPALGMMWYIRTYLWFALLSPLLLKVFRRLPLPMLIAPFALLTVWTEFLSSRVEPIGPVWDLTLYGTCWMLGFAHHDGLLRRLGPKAIALLTGTVGAAGICWIYTHPNPIKGYDINYIPIGNAPWSAAIVLLLFWLAPRIDSLIQWPRLKKIIGTLNSRAMTIYLWHPTAILLVMALFGYWQLDFTGAARMWVLVGVMVLVAVATLIFGWAEDLAVKLSKRQSRATPPLEPVVTQSGLDHQTREMAVYSQ